MDSEFTSTAGQTVSTWLDSLAAPIPNPGGGAASAVLLGIAAGLASMVAGYGATAEPGTPAEAADRVAGIAAEAHALQRRAPALADADAAASKGFATAFRIEEGAERSSAIVQASLSAAASAFDLGRTAVGFAPLLANLSRLGTPALRTDVAVAALTLSTVIRASIVNLGVDLTSALAHTVDAALLRRENAGLFAGVAELRRALPGLEQTAALIEHDVTRF
ncbi:hypothetical protein B7R54_12415 [Subtercola boreus]|uniref:Cyclodeaminase/cyclohydrolase domain-containing protein n=1 Tax=Subtercola boreus TaxID=120213 RepID=A0A3E0VLZ9_9MICO|nr:cyclodeaminase/cyclohydrolase family protein [Subtercola boreus]RFA09917.1 hypothetical protein B7R54_12415 [Subtercola boreus]TQL52947.1 formiminotetrahydrofolate cyclodeaminase [Subtercola boreus]